MPSVYFGLFLDHTRGVSYLRELDYIYDLFYLNKPDSLHEDIDLNEKKKGLTMTRTTIALICALIALLSCAEAHLGGLDNLRAKLRNRFEGSVPAYGGTVGSNGAYGGYGSGASSAASAAAATRGGRYGSGSSASAAAAASAGNSAYGGNGGYYGGYQAPAYTGGYEDGAATAYGYTGANNGYAATPLVQAPLKPRFRYGSDGYAGSAAAASAAASTNVEVLAPPPPRPVPPPRPAVNVNAFRGENVALNYGPPPVASRFAARRPPVAYYGAGGAAAASSAASAGAGGVASAASAASAGAGRVGGGAASQVLSSASGTYSNNDNGRESSAYKRSTENLQKHEDGRVDDNHYYNAQSYGKAEDEDLHEAFNKNDEDIEQTPTVYRSKKSGENYVMDFKKAHRESGSGVLAKDKHSSAFNKNSKKFRENVDQSHARSGAGVLVDENRVSTQNLDDEDEEIFDSDGFGQPLSAAGSGGAAAASSAAGGALGSGSVASSAAAAAARGI